MTELHFKGLFGALVVVFAAAGYFIRGHRYSWWTAAAGMAVAGLSVHYDSFWMIVVGVLTALWALICAFNSVDLGWRVRAGLTAVVAAGSFLCVWPTLEGLSQGKIPCPAYIKEKIDFRLVAGLDLRGGLRLVYTVDVEEAIKDKRNRYYDDLRQELAGAFGLKPADRSATREELVTLSEKVTVDKSRSSVSALLVKFKDQADAAKLEPIMAKFQNDLLRMPGPDPQTIQLKIRSNIETDIRERAVSQAKETIGRRVDELGLREAAVTVRDEDIIIEVPGQDEKTFVEIREIISKTARLEFKLVDDTVDFFRPIQTGSGEGLPQGVSFFAEEAPVGPGKTNRVTQARMARAPGETMKQARDRFREWLSTLNPPSDHEIGLGVLSEPDESGAIQEVGWRTYYLFSKAEVTGDQIRDAQATPDQDQRATGGWHVALNFTESGATRFEQITGDNIQKRFAIILDDSVESAPRILSKIGGGRATITMGSGDPQKQLEDSRKLELVLRSGALPAPISPSNEQRIGASLGTDAIKQGIYGALAGSVLVLVFMAIYYNVAGVIADVAVIFNLFIQIAVLSTFGAAMTLPGIAGLALTIGMAVDANVLINERIREELRAGKSPRTAVDLGYDKAFSAIIDGHMTTFISGLILAQYGTGPIKGFAVTLLVGMVVSLFTSVVCTRLAFDWWVRGLRVKTLNVGLARDTMEIFKPGRVYDFMGMRTFWVSLSVILTLLSAFGALVWPGPNYGTDFKGGTEVEIGFLKAVDVGKVREATQAAGFQHPDVVEVADPANPNRFLIRVQEVSSISEEQKKQLLSALCFSDLPEPPISAECPAGSHAVEAKFSPGGDKISLRYEANPDLDRIRKQVQSVGGVELRGSDRNPLLISPRDFKVEVALKSKGDLLVDGLRKNLGADVVPENALRVEWVGPKAGKQLRDAAIKSVAVAIVFIMAYVALRFDVRFAPGGILALIHDSMVVIGVFIALRKEITLSTIAAILTIVGYSIADTVIVYDRIRENLGKYRNKTFAEIINISISETISRTILTSGSVLLSMTMFFVWGTGVLKDFALALVVGVLAGTYSSIYVAAPLTELIDRRFFAGDGGRKAPKKRKLVARPARKSVA